MARCISRRYRSKLILIQVKLLSEKALMSELQEIRKLISYKECAEKVIHAIRSRIIYLGGLRYAANDVIEYEYVNSTCKDTKPFLLISLFEQTTLQEIANSNNNNNNSLSKEHELSTRESSEGVLCGVFSFVIKYNVPQSGLAGLNLLRASCALTNELYFDIEELINGNCKFVRKAQRLSEQSLMQLRHLNGLHFSAALCVLHVY